MGKTVKVVVILLIVTAVFVDCHSVPKRVETRAEKIKKERETYGKRMRAYMDQSVDPCDDFYQYSCGNYFKVKKVKHGVDETDVFGIVTDEMNEALHDIFTKSFDFGNYSVVEKVRNLYKSCMDVDIFNYPPGDPYLKVIDSIGGWPALDDSWTPEKFDWFNATRVFASYGANVFLFFGSDNRLLIGPDEFGVREELKDRPFSRSYTVNQKLIMKILSMYNLPYKKAKKIFLEIVQLSKQWSKFVKQHTVTFTPGYGVYRFDKLKEEISEIDWDKYFGTLFDKELDSSLIFFCKDKEILKNLPKFMESQNKEVIANYMITKFLYALHNEFEHPQYHKDFCIDIIQKLMGDVVTAMYINSPHHKETVEDEVMSMAAYMRSAFKVIVADIDWMDMETKRKALVKLRDMRMIIGDVELTLDFKGLEQQYKDIPIEAGSNYFENNLKLKKYIMKKKIPGYEENEDKYVEKYAADVNAYYNPRQNKMILPAGILRKPFFDPNLPKSYNFGAMGANIIGHEMTHGFDSSGRHFDHNGDTEDWWSPESDSAFEERAKCFVDQYDSYRIEEINTNVEGNTTLGENIADTGGVRQGFIAYHKWLNANQNFIDMASETLPTLNLTNDQLYFVAYAQTYCGSYKRKAYEVLASDPHAVNKFRVIGSVSNFDEFGKQFNCPLGTTMNPEKKCVLW